MKNSKFDPYDIENEMILDDIEEDREYEESNKYMFNPSLESISGGEYGYDDEQWN